jgi:serine/threonine protein phosphatase 1
MHDGYFVIGDIHGYIEQLMEILETHKKYPNHKIVFLGDYIDRGPSSEEVIQAIKKVDGIFLKGNHEDMLLERIGLCADETVIMDLLRFNNLSENSVEWIRTELVPCYETNDYIFVHAGLDASKSLSQQSDNDYMWSRYIGSYEHITSKLVIHGHTVVAAPELIGNRLNINTGCGMGGYLTALVLPENIFYKSSDTPGEEHNWVRMKRELDDTLTELTAE